VKISRNIPIKGIIFKEDDVQRIITLFDCELNALGSNSNRIKMLLKAQFDDGTIFESDRSNEFFSSELIKIKRLLL
jgi:hypothetical protein